ncbi:MAG: hypothetical protein AB9842_13310 [Bacteroidales bacterium]
MNTAIYFRKCRSLIIFSLLVIFTIFAKNSFSVSQADSATEKNSTSMSLYHSKLGTGNHLIKATLSSKTEDGRVFLMGRKVKFVGGADLSIEFGESKTNDQGVATFTIPKEKIPARDSSGSLTLGAKFEGDSLFESTEDQVSTQALVIDVTAVEEDSLKTITAFAYSLGADGTKTPLTATDIFFYIPRMFSYLKIGEGQLDSTGTFTIEFPLDIPGDSLGNLVVIARVEDHELYGNTEGQTTVKWGIPTQLFVKSTYRALWSQIAPTWMVVTLIILLAGVWGHYAYAVYKLVKIKKEAQKLQS